MTGFDLLAGQQALAMVHLHDHDSDKSLRFNNGTGFHIHLSLADIFSQPCGKAGGSAPLLAALESAVCFQDGL